MTVMTEVELKESFAVKVEHPLGLINYRAYEESIKGIELELEGELSLKQRAKLFRIRKDMKKIMHEL